MRRKDREITDRSKINEIIKSCHCCRLGFCDGGRAYIVPLNFGFEIDGDRRIFYFHSATEGRKIDLIDKTHFASFELDTNYMLHTGEKACDYAARFDCVMGEGRVDFITDREEKIRALNLIMQHYTDKNCWAYDEKLLNAMTVFKLEVQDISCKQHL